MRSGACDTLTCDEPQQALHGSVSRDVERGRDVGERTHYERPLMHARMRDDEPASVHTAAAE